MNFIEKNFRKPWTPFCMYIGVSFLLYGASLFYGLTFLDDNVWLKEYRWYLKDIHRVFRVFTENDILFGQLFYRPLIYVSFILDTQWAGSGLVSYHWTNIWLHILNTSLIFLLLQKFQFSRRTSFWGGLVFCAHPVFVSAVAWIPGRTDSLLAVFVFSSFYYFIRWAEGGEKRNFWAHSLFLFFALLTKETAVAVPLLALWYFFLFARQKLRAKQIGFVSAFWGCLFAGYFVIRHGGIHEKYTTDLGPMLASLWKNLPALIPYLGKSLLPFNLSVLPVMEDLTFVYGFGTLILLGVLSWRVQTQRTKVLIFGISWFLLFLLPSLVYSFLKHEYRLYVPMFGFLLVVLDLIKNHRWHIPGLMITTLVFSALTLQHSTHYADHFSFWQNAVKTSEHSPLAHRNLGAMYYLNKQLGLAEKEFEKALQLNPKEKMCYNNLGLIYERRGNPLQAEKAYLKEIEINPYYDGVYFNLGLFYYKRGLGKNAEVLWKKTIQLNPRYAMAYQHLIQYYLYTEKSSLAGKYADALKQQGGQVHPQLLQQLEEIKKTN